MNCNEVKELLSAFADGELEQSRAQAVEAALSDCPECQAELEEIRLISTFARDALTSTLPETDLSGVYDGVMARIAAEEQVAAIDGVRVQREADQQTVTDRIIEWFRAAFTLQRPLASAVLAIILIGGIALLVNQSGDTSNTGSTVPTIANVDKPSNGRRGPEYEQKVGPNTAFIDHVEVAEGEIRIDLNEEDPDQPLVLWHVVEGETGL